MDISYYSKYSRKLTSNNITLANILEEYMNQY